MTTGALVRKARESAGLSRQQLADATGIPLRTLEKIEQDVIGHPRFDHVMAIAAATGQPCTAFQEATGEPDVPTPAPEPPAKGRRGRGRR